MPNKITESSIPQSETELLLRAKSIAGLTFAELAAELNLPIPRDLKRNKAQDHSD